MKGNRFNPPPVFAVASMIATPDCTAKTPPRLKVNNDFRGLVAILTALLLVGCFVLGEMSGRSDAPPIETPPPTRDFVGPPTPEPRPTTHALRPAGNPLFANVPPLAVEGELTAHEQAIANEQSDLLLPDNPLRLGGQPDAPRFWQ
jgi:hypothetical protein